MQKGQAAIEYLLNYGWMMLVLALIVGFVIASGAFSPTRFFRDECFVHPELPCIAAVVSSDQVSSTTLLTGFVNTMKGNISIISINATLNDNQIGTCDLTPSIGIPIQQGEDFTVECTWTGETLMETEVATVKLGIDYKDPLLVTHIASGKIRTLVQTG